MERYEYILHAIQIVESKPQTSLKRWIDRIHTMEVRGGVTESDVRMMMRMIGDLQDALLEIAFSHISDVSEFAAFARQRASSVLDGREEP
jgi:hypothetical protein